MTRRFMWKRKLSQRAPACYYIASAFGIQRVVKHTNNQGAVGAGAKNGKHTPATFSFRNCPILDSNISRTGRSSGSSINTQTDPSARMRLHIGRCSELIDEHKKAARNGKMTI
jgi:hypothetical protein